MNKVIVLIDDFTQKKTIQDSLVKILEISENDVEIILFQSLKSKELEAENSISPRDFGWNGNIKTEKARKSLTKKYDLLINYCKVENIYTNLLILQIQAAFKIGFATFDKRFYDLTIDCRYDEVELFNKEIKKYLKILSKL